MREINLAQMPFTCRDSYMAVSWISENYQNFGNAPGLYLRTIHNSTITPLIAGISLKGANEKACLDYTALIFQGEGKIQCCFADPCTMLICGTAGTEVRMDFLTDSGPYDYIYEIETEDKILYMANCYKNNNRYLVWVQEGTCTLDQKWEESSSLYSRLEIGGDDGFLCIVREIETEWDRQVPVYDFDASRDACEKDFLDFYSRMPEIAPEYEEMGCLAAYLNWSSIVRPNGFLKREAMYMSKNWMTNVWSWDHCFNAIALSYANPDLAWDTYIIMADFQDRTGRLPDSVSDNHIIWNYCKPPVHGWALRRMMEHMELTETQLREAYDFLSRWTGWWMDYRRKDGLYYYDHGNDSGWDNSTAFSKLPPVATPELQADMIIQMRVLAQLAQRLGETQKAAFWAGSAQEHLDLFLHRCFRDNLPVAIQCSTGEIVENKSLLPYEILILGTSLPEEIREAVISLVSSETFFTEYGFATESPSSGFYRSDGYWRGPVWAPSTILMIDGLVQCGEKALAREAAKRFLKLVQKSGFAENFDALTGEGLRDRAHTWTASVAIILAAEINI